MTVYEALNLVLCPSVVDVDESNHVPLKGTHRGLEQMKEETDYRTRRPISLGRDPSILIIGKQSPFNFVSKRSEYVSSPEKVAFLFNPKPYFKRYQFFAEKKVAR